VQTRQLWRFFVDSVKASRLRWSLNREDLGVWGAPVIDSSINEFYRSRDIAQLLGISRRQLQYWAQTGLLHPSRQTRGGHYRYSFQDLVALKAAKRLIDAGVSVQRIRKSISALQQMLPTVRRPLAELVLVATGDLVLVFHEGAAFEAISGQEWVLEVAEFQREVRAWRGQAHVQRIRSTSQARTRLSSAVSTAR